MKVLQGFIINGPNAVIDENVAEEDSQDKDVNVIVSISLVNVKQTFCVNEKQSSILKSWMLFQPEPKAFGLSLKKYCFNF